LPRKKEATVHAASWIFAGALILSPIANAQIALPDNPSNGQRGSTAPIHLPSTQQPNQAVIMASTQFAMGQERIKGSPYSATGQIVQEQTLADGTAIHNTTEFSLWRDAEGRLRSEFAMKLGSGDDSVHAVEVQDPVDGVVLIWSASDSLPLRTVRRMRVLEPLPDPKMAGVLASGPPPSPPTPGGIPHHVTLPTAPHPSTSNVRTETLPSDTIAGLYVEGTRTTEVIPAGAQGNDRDIAIVSETWKSPDLRMMVRQMTDDPRTGKLTVEVTTIDRTDPDPSLFKIPEGYTVMDMPSAFDRPHPTSQPAKPQQ
jgi:hypothetical protein